MITPSRAYLLQSLSHLAVNKTRAKNESQTKDELIETVETFHEILLSAKTVFPFTLFPDTVSVDRTNLTIAHRVFFRVAVLITIKIEDILNITPNIGPFFGSLKITTNFVDENSPYNVNYLLRDDALKINRLLNGYKLALEQEIDCSALDKDELVKLFDRLARDGTEV